MMKTFITYMTMLVAFCGVISSCQDIEDTYKEYAGDGPIQYLNKIYDLKATSQWESVLLNWTLKLDAGRTDILVEWKDASDTHSQVLDKNSNSFLIEGLTENYDYEFNVYAIRVEDGEIVKKSLGDAVYARPFTAQSDELSLFTHVVIKQIKVADKKIFALFDAWPDNLVSFKIGYFEKGINEEKFFEPDRVNNWPNGLPYAIIGEDVDFNKPVRVYRVGNIASFGNKVLDLEPLVLYFDLPTFNTDFANELRPQIGVVGEIKPDDIKNLSSVNINFNQTSLEDILYFPELKTVNLGKDRYLMAGTEETTKSSLSSDINRTVSLAALKLAHDLLGVQVYQYSKHYFDQSPDWFSGKNLPVQLPMLQFLDPSAWEITETPEEAVGAESGLQNLLLDNMAYWFPIGATSLRTHIIEIDMHEIKNILGFKIVQANINDIYLKMPELVKIEIFGPVGSWIPAAFNEDLAIGNGKGESTLIYLDKDKTMKQTSKIRLQISDSYYKSGYVSGANVNYYRTALASFMVIAE